MAILKRTLHGTIVPVVLLFAWEALTQSGFHHPQILPAAVAGSAEVDCLSETA